MDQERVFWSAISQAEKRGTSAIAGARAEVCYVPRKKSEACRLSACMSEPFSAAFLLAVLRALVRLMRVLIRAVCPLATTTKAGTAGVGMFSRQLYWETAEPPAMPTLVDAAKIPFG